MTRLCALAVSLGLSALAAAAEPPPPAVARSPDAQGARPPEAQPQEELAPEPPRPTLEDRIPPVSAQAFTRAHKFEITVGVGLSLNDAFVEKVIPELSLGYHIDEAFYVGLRGGYAFDFGAGHVEACDTTGTTCGAPTADQLKQLPGNFTAYGAVQFAWSPIYGKLNFLAGMVLHFDTSLLLDGGVLYLGEQTGSNNGRVAPEFSPGLGQRFFFTQAFALALELRDMIYASGGAQNQIIFHVGFTFLL